MDKHDTRIDFGEHARRVRRELELYQPSSPRWQAARAVAIAACDLRETLSETDPASRTLPH